MTKKSGQTDAEAIVFLKNNISELQLPKEEQIFVSNEVKGGKEMVTLQRLNRVAFFIPVSKETDDAGLEALRGKGNDIQSVVNRMKISSLRLNDRSGNDSAGRAVAEGIALGNYQFLKYLKAKKEKQNSLGHIYVERKSGNSSEIEELNVLTAATLLARDLVNEPVSFLTAEQFSKEMVRAGKMAGFKVEVLNKKQIEAHKMGGLLAVNRGSIDHPTFTIMEYKPKNAKNKKPVVLIGKGVVFDTGGLSLKPTPGSMDEMKCDMAGAAAVVGAMYSIAGNKLPVHVVGLVPATDNRPGMNAVAPQDIITMHDGSTVEVLNTDAEGRLILADALSYAKKYNPELCIDLATLTGAAVRAIGSYASAIMGTASHSAMKKLAESGMSVWERTVEFPLWKEYGDEMKSDIADLKNLGSANAGQITAGKFLEHFTDYPWIHIDIAGPAYINGANSYRTKGGTGVGVRLLFDFIKKNYC
ncbi:MAG: peptidase M17 [Crocinitomicaceae bacterium]|nr:peptidase M17 [Crocinitomicaceae bacterium]